MKEHVERYMALASSITILAVSLCLFLTQTNIYAEDIAAAVHLKSMGIIGNYYYGAHKLCS